MSQQEFNEQHKIPVLYGEDGDRYGVSSEYTAEQAGKLFEEEWLKNTGEVVDFHYSIGVAGFKRMADGWAITEINPDAEGLLVHF